MKRKIKPSAFREGADAYVAGTPLARCPYSFGTADAEQWRDGWKVMNQTLAKQEPVKEGVHGA